MSTESKVYEPRQKPPPPRHEFRLVTFTYLNANAKRVCVAGDFNNWSPDADPMGRTDSGVWFRLVQLTPGKHEYRLVVDSKWTENPLAVASIHNSHGGRNSIILV